MTAARTTEMSVNTAISWLRILQRHLQDDISSVAAPIDHFLQESIKVVQKNNLFRVVTASEKIPQPIQFELVGVAFNTLELAIHLPRGAGVDPFAQLFYHCQ